MLFTVFTPVYNRRHTIHRVWESLLAQNRTDFEWVIVDDGSTDGVADTLADYVSQAPFPVRVLVQSKNSGKHQAWNRAMRQARGELFVVADSDDAFIPQSLGLMAEMWGSIPAEKRHGYAGINVLCRDGASGKIVGDPYPCNGMDSNSLDLAYLHRVEGEKWGCVRTDLLKKHPFPLVGGSHFAENYVWHALARRYKTRCFNTALRIFYQNDSSDRLSNERGASLDKGRYQAMYRWNYLHLNMNGDYMLRKPKEIIVTLANLGKTGLVLGEYLNSSLGRLKRRWTRWAFVCLYPLAMALYWRDCRQGRIADTTAPR
jgi:glycosyltransferase involved in cell wall biosynthesis